MRLVVSYSGALGGAERVLVDFARGLEPGCVLACPPGPLFDAATDRGLPVFALRAHSLELRRSTRDRLLAPARILSHALDARRLIEALDPDLVIASGMRSGVALVLPGIVRRAPIAFEHHDLIPGLVAGAALRAAARAAARVVVPSNTVASDLDPDHKLGARVTTVSPGVDAAAFADLGPPSDPPEVLVLGAIEGWKRPDVALEALALARARRPELRLRLVGAPIGEAGLALLAALRERCTRPDLAGHVELPGAVGDVRPELERASCLLHCAPREPFGVAVLEALAAGRPVVAPDAGGPSEIVDSSCAVLYGPGEAADAAHALLTVLEDPRRRDRMGASGRALVRRRFDGAAARAAFASAVVPVERPRARPLAEADELAFVTVTHNSANELELLLRSVARHLPDTRMVIVDCDSADETLAVASGWTDRLALQTIALRRNVGYGAGCNRGMEAVKAPITALVNPDVVLLDDSLLCLAGEALSHDRLLAPRVLGYDGVRQDSVHPAPSSAADLARSLIPPGLVHGRAGVTLAPWRSQVPRKVGWAMGCAVVAQTRTLVRLGPFDERIFLYGEDLDLGLRAAAAGVETWFWPAGRVVHGGAHSTGRAFGGEPFERLAQARHDVVARRLGARRARLDDAAQTLTFTSRIALKRMLRREVSRERSQLAALRSLGRP
jgi:glycosyltransferase involved in cell wall biosynthesis/GT2 family glycosyltransferase